MVQKEQFDAVLMDWQMPKMDGLEATRHIRAMPRFSDLPIIAMSANAMKGDVEKCLEAGMNAHIAKPVEVATLMATLARWIPANPTERFSSKAVEVTQARHGSGGTGQLPPIPGVDVAGALTRLRGNAISYRKYLALFVSMHREDASAVAELLAANNVSAAKMKLHDLKGLALLLGADSLAAAAADLELALRNEGNPGATSSSMSAVQAQLDTLVASLENLGLASSA
jgi:polar amino acid transport system substrate-binding protein